MQLQLASAVCVKGLQPQFDRYVAATVAVWLLKFIAVPVTTTASEFMVKLISWLPTPPTPFEPGSDRMSGTDPIIFGEDVIERA